MLLGGVGSHSEALARRGLGAEFTTKWEGQLALVERLNREQEALKARLAEKTVELNTAQDDLDDMTGEVKKTVKIEFPKETWKEFGISDAR